LRRRIGFAPGKKKLLLPRVPLSVSVALVMLAAIPARANQNDTGLASFYSDVPDKSEMLSAAHRSLAFGTMVSVVRVDTGAHVVVRINDRGPFIRGRIIDLSCSAAEQLGMVDVGVAPVTVQVIPAPVPAIRKSRPPQ